MDEVWEDVVGYEEFYEVSNLGNVKSFDRKVWNGRVHCTKRGKLLKQSLTTTRCKKIELVDANGVKKSRKVHRIVAFAFIKQIEGKNLINHIDGNPINNRVENLEWCTQSENMKHAAENQLMPNAFHLHKEKIVSEYQNDNKTNVRMLARKYSCSDKTIRLYFKELNIPIRGTSHTQNVYGINRIDLARDFDNGLKNKALSLKYKTNSRLIAVYRCNYKKGVFI
jgi:hypothetical protein